MRGFKLPILAVALALSGASCNPVVDDNQSAVTLAAAFQGQGGAVGPIGIFADVVQADGVPADDFFELNVRALAKNVNSDPSEFYTVNFQAVTLRYTRPDGRNEPGVDVPFPLTYAIGGSVTPGDEAQLNLLVVSEEMKLEPPLRDLWFGEGQRIFATLHLTVFGRDLVENELTADASAVVVFGDFPG